MDDLGLRDLLITTIVFGSIPLIFKKPYIGILMWCWLGYMSPHRLSFGFAYTMPFAAIIAGVTMVSLVLHKDQRQSIPYQNIVILWVFFIIWTGITTYLAFYPTSAWIIYKKFFKIIAMTLVMLMLIIDKDKLNKLIWAIVLSLGFFGVKGGVFTILKGGSSIVWGPPGSFVEGNNELALALLMIIPLANYLRVISKNKWIKLGFLGAMVLIGVSAIGSQSRGAFLAAGAMIFYFWTKSDKKVVSGLALLIVAGNIYAFMPQSWHNRMDTIATYEQDGSAMGRINAWWEAYNVANDRFFGAGFNHYSVETFALYAPNPEDVHAAHSIYFQVLGGHGWVGFAVYMMFCILSLRLSKKLTKKTKGIEELAWASLLSKMVYVSLIAYAVGGAFLSLAYFDLPYHLMAILILTNLIVDRALKEPIESKIKIGKRVKEELMPESENLGKGLTNKVTYSKY